MRKKKERMPDEEIDYRDIPKEPADFWADAVRGGLYRPVNGS